MKKLFYSMLVFCLAFNAMSQSISLEGVKGTRYRGIKTIRSNEDGQISGYYTYYMAERGKKGERTFEFSIIDKELKTVNKVPITLHKTSIINNTVFNGKYFLISYENRKEKKIVMKVIDLNGKIVKSNEILVDKKWQTASTIYPAANAEGYYVVRNVYERKQKRFGFSVEKMDNNLKSVWKIEDVVEKGGISVADFINNKDRFVLWKETGIGNKIKPVISCYDSKTGKKIFEREGYDGTSTILYNQVRITEDGGVVAGGSYVDGEKYKTVNTTGVYLLKLSSTGKEMLYTKVNNKEKIQSVLKATSKGFTVGSKDKIWVEDLIVDGDNITIISEMFRKSINPKPAAYQTPRDLISGKFVGDINYRNDQGKKPKVTFEIMDYILFKFNSKTGLLDEIKPIAKNNSTKITVYYPYYGYNGMTMAKLMERFGWFDYNFTTTGPNGEKVMVCSNNSEARKPQVFTYTLDGNYTAKEINLKQEAKINLDDAKVSSFGTLRNEGKKFAVVYYQRKLKKVTINLESIY